MPSEVVERLEAVSDNDNAAERKLLELKICERCGGLWLRPAGSRWVYCGPCKLHVDDLPPVDQALRTRPARHPQANAPKKPRLRKRRRSRKDNGAVEAGSGSERVQ